MELPEAGEGTPQTSPPQAQTESSCEVFFIFQYLATDIIEKQPILKPQGATELQRR